MNKKLMIFLEPDDASGGGEGEAPASATYDPWAPKDEGGDTTVIEKPVVEAPATPVATIDPKAFEAFGKSFGETFAKTQRENAPAAPPTPEQIAEARKSLKFFDITPEFVAKFGNMETQAKALEEYRDGITQHIITVMNHLRANDQTEFKRNFDERLTPLQAMIEERQNSEKQTRFNSRFPQFAKPEIAPAINATISQLASSKAFKGKTEAEAFKLVAEKLSEQAKAYNPNFVLEDVGASSHSSSQPNRASNSLPVTSPGSGASRTGAPTSGSKNWALAHLK